jgi:hypothetical protein
MALSLKTVKGVVHLMWSTPAMEAQWKIRPNMSEKEILETLERVIQFVRTQNGEIAALAAEIRGTSAPVSVSPAEQATATTAGASPTPPAGSRVPMMPPASLSDTPAGGPPPRDGFSWDQFPTTVVPEHLASATGGGWEMIPPGEA